MTPARASISGAQPRDVDHLAWRSPRPHGPAGEERVAGAEQRGDVERRERDQPDDGAVAHAREAPVRRQRGGAGRRRVVRRPRVPCSAPGLASRLPRVGGGGGGRRSSGADVAPRGPVAVAVHRPHRAERVGLRLVGVERPRVAGVDQRRVGPQPQVARRSDEARVDPALRAGASAWPSTAPEIPAWKPHTTESARFACAPAATRTPAAPVPKTVRCAAVSVPDSTSRPRRAARCASARGPRRPGRPRSTTTAAPTRRAAAPAPTTCRSLASPRTASAVPVASRTVSAAIDERSSPRSTRPASSVTRRPAPTTRTGSPAASVTSASSVRRPIRIVSSPGSSAAACERRGHASAASTQPGSRACRRRTSPPAPPRRARAPAPAAAQDVSPLAKANRGRRAAARRAGPPGPRRAPPARRPPTAARQPSPGRARAAARARSAASCTSRCGSRSRSDSYSTSPSSSTSTSIGRGPWRTPPGSRPSARSTALHASSSASGPSSVSIRTHALRNSGWSSTSPTGSVSYTDEEASDLHAVRPQLLDRRLQHRAPVADVRAEPEVAEPLTDADHRELARLGEQRAVGGPQLAVLLPRAAGGEARAVVGQHPLARRRQRARGSGSSGRTSGAERTAELRERRRHPAVRHRGHARGGRAARRASAASTRGCARRRPAERPPSTQRMSKRSWKRGAPSTRCSRRSPPGGGAAGACRSAHSGSPSRQVAHAPSASAIGRPSCSIRRLTRGLERPARSTSTHDLDRPGLRRVDEVHGERARRPRRVVRPRPPSPARGTPRGSRRTARARSTSASETSPRQRPSPYATRARCRRPGVTPPRSPSRACSRASGRGAHQFHRPSSAISDGTSSARTMNASISTASAVPTPSSLMNTTSEVANAPIAMQNSSAA